MLPNYLCRPTYTRPSKQFMSQTINIRLSLRAGVRGDKSVRCAETFRVQSTCVGSQLGCRIVWKLVFLHNGRANLIIYFAKKYVSENDSNVHYIDFAVQQKINVSIATKIISRSRTNPICYSSFCSSSSSSWGDPSKKPTTPS